MKNKTTDVLSFPSEASVNGTRKRTFAGEIAISANIAVENAARLGHSAALEVKVLALHGILHLAGFDHERDNGRDGAEGSDPTPEARSSPISDRTRRARWARAGDVLQPFAFEERAEERMILSVAFALILLVGF